MFEREAGAVSEMASSFDRQCRGRVGTHGRASLGTPITSVAPNEGRLFRRDGETHARDGRAPRSAQPLNGSASQRNALTLQLFNRLHPFNHLTIPLFPLPSRPWRRRSNRSSVSWRSNGDFPKITSYPPSDRCWNLPNGASKQRVSLVQAK